MKILLITSKAMHAKHLPALPLGLLSIATYLSQNGHIVQIYDREVERGRIKSIEKFSPDIVGISGHSYQNCPDAFKLAKHYKKRGVPVVVGGQMPTVSPENVLKNGVVDYVIFGEGEESFLALLDAIAQGLPLRDIDGLAFIENGEIIVNKSRELADLSNLPIIDFKFIAPEKYFGPYIGCEKMLFVYASKGCLFQCTYCYNSCLAKNAWRARPPEYFLSEIKYLVENHQMDGVFFIDDLFGPSPAYVQMICEKIIESGIEFVWGCYTRADLCTKETLQKMHDAGCRWIMFGIESGSEERQKTTKKRLSLNKTKEIVAYCKEVGIFTNTTFMLGFPGETDEELKQTVKFMQELDADAKVPNYCGILPKSEMYEDLVKNKTIKMNNKNMKACTDFKMMDNLGQNYSKISNKELKVVSAVFYWNGLFVKDTHSEQNSRVFTRRAIMQTLNLSNRGIGNTLFLIITAAKELTSIIYYAKMFPKIRKKYGL